MKEKGQKEGYINIMNIQYFNIAKIKNNKIFYMIEGRRVFTFNLLQKMRWMTGSSNDWGKALFFWRRVNQATFNA